MMASSVQIYNLSHNIDEDDLQYLQLFTEYGRLTLEATGKKPFQKLLFLVRDWQYKFQKPYGFEGGNNLLEQRLLVSKNQKPELKRLREDIKPCFVETCCFLMPNPGKRSGGPKFGSEALGGKPRAALVALWMRPPTMVTSVFERDRYGRR